MLFTKEIEENVVFARVMQSIRETMNGLTVPSLILFIFTTNSDNSETVLD